MGFSSASSQPLRDCCSIWHTTRMRLCASPDAVICVCARVQNSSCLGRRQKVGAACESGPSSSHSSRLSARCEIVLEDRRAPILPLPERPNKAQHDPRGGARRQEPDENARRKLAQLEHRPVPRPPAEADIQQYFGVSPSSVHQMMLTLERAGFIARQPGVPAALKCSLLHKPAGPALIPSSTVQNHCAEIIVARSSNARASYPVLVHQLAHLLRASFRPRLAAIALAHR